MSKDVTRVTDNLCCCRMLFIYQGVYLIAFHCFLLAAYGIGLVITSSYKPQNNVINYITIASNLCLIPTGIFLFWVNIYESWKAARIACFIIIPLTIFNLVTALVYFAVYVNFEANSALDKNLFRGKKNWTSSEDMPITAWHVLTLALVLISSLWFYYGHMTWKLANYLRRNSK